jgi:hypothetical protein
LSNLAKSIRKSHSHFNDKNQTKEEKVHMPVQHLTTIFIVIKDTTDKHMSQQQNLSPPLGITFLFALLSKLNSHINVAVISSHQPQNHQSITA